MFCTFIIVNVYVFANEKIDIYGLPSTEYWYNITNIINSRLSSILVGAGYD